LSAGEWFGATVVEPADENETASILRSANDTGQAVIPAGGGTKLDWGNPPRKADILLSVRRMNRVIEHAWADLTVTVEAGCTIAEVQRTLAEHGQRLAVDPLWPERATVGGILATNDSGALRLAFGALRLAEQLELPQPWPELLTFCVLSSQMIWATVAHVANDWLAVPLALWLLVLTIDFHERGTMRRAVVCALVLALGLLTKAYFLAFIPLLASVFFLRRRFREAVAAGIILIVAAGPWYYRNIARYGTISGMQELRIGIHPADALRVHGACLGLRADVLRVDGAVTLPEGVSADDQRQRKQAHEERLFSQAIQWLEVDKIPYRNERRIS